MERALELDPLSLIINMEMGWLQYMARDNGRAIEQALKTIDMEPQFSAAHHVLALAHEQMGNHKKAIDAFKKAQAGSPGNPTSLAALAHGFASAGRKSEAREILAGLRKRGKRSFIPYYVYSVLYFALDEKAQGLKWLEKACNERDPWLIWILKDPRLDSVRQEPRFLEVLRRMKLPPEESIDY
jgi:tetratricopeptide (TPR) repeat protein